MGRLMRYLRLETLIAALIFVTLGCKCGGDGAVSPLSPDTGDADITAFPDEDGKDGGMVRDAGRDSGSEVPDSGMNDVEMNDVGMDDAGPVYDYHAGKDYGNPLGTDFSFVAVGGMHISFDGDYFVFDKPNEGGWRNPYWIFADVCWFKTSTLETKCIKLDENKRKYQFFGPSDLFVRNGNIYWTFNREDDDYENYPKIQTFNPARLTGSSIYQCDKCGLEGFGANSRQLIFSQYEMSKGSLMYILELSSGKATAFKTALHSSDPNLDLFVYEDFAFFRMFNTETQVDGPYIRYNIKNAGIDEIPQLLKALVTGQSGSKLLLASGPGSGPYSIQSYDVINDSLETIYTGSSIGIPRYCTSDVLLWYESVDGGGVRVVIFDVSSSVKRYIPVPGNIGAMCSGSDVVISPDSGAMRRYYHLNLEKSGYMKDGHVVREGR